jgi:uncharacterized protein (TIGR02246 family)
VAQSTEDIAAIRQLAKDWHAGWDGGDVDALLALYADDPILMPQNQPVVIGRDAIRSLYTAVFQEYVIVGNGEQREIDVDEDLGYFWSTYSLTATPKNGGDMLKDEGKCVFIVKRQPDGSWCIARLIASSDLPIAGGG